MLQRNNISTMPMPESGVSNCLRNCKSACSSACPICCYGREATARACFSHLLIKRVCVEDAKACCFTDSETPVVLIEANMQALRWPTHPADL